MFKGFTINESRLISHRLRIIATFVGVILLSRTNLFAQSQPDTLVIEAIDTSDNDGVIRNVQQTNDGEYTDGEYMVVGYSVLHLIKKNADGDTIWMKTYETSNSDGILSVQQASVQQTIDDGYITVDYDYTNIGNDNSEVYLIKKDANDDTVWIKTYDASNSNGDLTDNGYIRVCHTDAKNGNSDVHLIRTDANGETRTSIGTGSDNECIIAGIGLTGIGTFDVCLIKINANGDTVWTEAYGGDAHKQGYSVQQTNDDGCIIIGYTYGLGVVNNDICLMKSAAENSLGTEETEGRIKKFDLLQNRPNPFTSYTTVSYALPKDAYTKITVYSTSGQKIATLLNQKMEAGSHSIKWDGRDAKGKEVAPGIYFYRMEAGNFKAIRKLTILR